MEIITKLVIDIESGAVLERESYAYTGMVLWCKGPSADQKALAKEQLAFTRKLSSAWDTRFAGQDEIIKGLRTSLEPILSAGIGQFGYTPEEEAAMRTKASETTSKEFTSAAKGLGEKLAARGSGNVFIPSGAEDQLYAGLFGQAAEVESGRQQDITKSGFDTGRSNYLTALQGLGTVAQIQDPLGVAGQFTTSGTSTNKTYSDIAAEEQAASPWGAIGGLVGGALGAFTGGLGSGLAKKITT
jgi:hypothetical protein